jgi:hypothetical protein
MSIFLDLAGRSGTAFFNLETISGESGNVGIEDVPGDPTVFQISYVDTAGQPATADRLGQLVNNNFPGPVVTTQDIVVTAINGGNDPYLGIDVTCNGFTYLDGDVIRVVYDVSQGCGAGLALFDTDGNPISTPNPVILYHELSHAFRAVTDRQEDNDEIPAETDENVLRSQLGLCLRDVNNHDGGCGPGDDCGGSAGNEDGGPPAGGCAAGNDGGCFIVSVTTGSSESDEVNRLRQLRDRVGSVSGLSAQLIDVIYGEYYQFSPAIAAELEQDAFARQAVLWVVVRPLLAWYTLAGTLAFDQDNEEAVKRAARDVLSACPRYLSGSVVALLEAIRSGESLPADAPQLLLDFAPRIQEAARFRCASWAILDPLTRAWRSADSGLDVVEEVSQWLATAPLEVLAPPSDPQLLDLELGTSASFFNFRPAAKRQLGERLAAAWPDATAVLARHGFIN